jgi:hypothetical protein
MVGYSDPPCYQVSKKKLFLLNRLSENDEILNFCFEKLTSKDLCQKSAALIEVIFLHRPKTLNLCSLPNLQVIIQKLDGQLLANFCKILSLAISDLDMYDQVGSYFCSMFWRFDSAKLDQNKIFIIL